MANDDRLDNEMRKQIHKVIKEASRPPVPAPSSHEASTSGSLAKAGSSQQKERRGQKVQFGGEISRQEKQLTESISKMLKQRAQKKEREIKAIEKEAEYEVMMALKHSLPYVAKKMQLRLIKHRIKRKP